MENLRLLSMEKNKKMFNGDNLQGYGTEFSWGL